MKVLKFCFRTDPDMSNLVDNIIACLSQQSLQVHVQYIDSTPYLKWLKNMKTMSWKVIVDIIWDKPDLSVDGIYGTFMNYLQREKIFMADVDCYLGEQIIYQKPVDNSELITSCYLWNYDNPSSIREEKMKEHFGMEQRQIYYDYVSFQSITKIMSVNSPRYDFFFESHVSKPEGINEIYSKPALEGMREHSQAFLNVSTRELSFGKVLCFGV